MSLAEKNWSAASLHKVLLAWLRAERESRLAKLFEPLPADWSAIEPLLLHPDLNSAGQNRQRLRTFYLARGPFFGEIPPDTTWHEVRNLTDDDLGELYVVNYPEWTDPADRNELHKVAARKHLPLKSQPATWEPPILWGHDRAGPFTIIEGNNRLTSYVHSGQSGLDIPVLVGLSPLRSIFHMLDNHPPFLLYDLWKGT